MNTSTKLKILIGILLLICSGCSTTMGKECAFIEITEWSEESKNFLRMPRGFSQIDITYTDENGIVYYSHAPDFLFEDMKPTFRNNRNSKKHC
jgi:hypothetical protein